MRNKHLTLVFFMLLFVCLGCKNRSVHKESRQGNETAKTEVRDTVFIEKIVTNTVIKTDTVEKKIFDFQLAGKPKYDSINKVWLPLFFDYTVYSGQDSIRHKGSFTGGDFDIKSGIDWEKAYYNLKQSYESKEKESKGSGASVVTSKEFKENVKAVQSEGSSLEMMLYTVLATAVVFYFLGLISPTLWKQIKARFLGGKITNIFK